MSSNLRVKFVGEDIDARELRTGDWYFRGAQLFRVLTNGVAQSDNSTYSIPAGTVKRVAHNNSDRVEFFGIEDERPELRKAIEYRDAKITNLNDRISQLECNIADLTAQLAEPHYPAEPRFKRGDVIIDGDNCLVVVREVHYDHYDTSLVSVYLNWGEEASKYKCDHQHAKPAAFPARIEMPKPDKCS